LISVGSYIGGCIQDRRGPRVVALTGGVIYGLGVIMASFADKDRFWILILGIVGPLLISSLIGEQKAYTLGFTVVGLIALAGMVLPLLTKKPAAPLTRSAASAEVTSRR
jgi:hypothetical protein